MTCEKNDKFQAQVLGTCCVVFWNINDVFNGQAMIVFETHNEYQRQMMRIFTLAMEMGVLPNDTHIHRSRSAGARRRGKSQSNSMCLPV
jgi:hypothetical protein